MRAYFWGKMNMYWHFFYHYSIFVMVQVVELPPYRWQDTFYTSLSIMMTSSNGNMLRVTGPLCGEFPGHRWIPRTKASDAELWCFLKARKNGWINGREAGDLIRHRAHCDVTVMIANNDALTSQLTWSSATMVWLISPGIARPRHQKGHLFSPKWPPICRRYFHMHVRELKVLCFDQNSTEVCS